jgi:hypothetical protein
MISTSCRQVPKQQYTLQDLKLNKIDTTYAPASSPMRFSCSSLFLALVFCSFGFRSTRLTCLRALLVICRAFLSPIDETLGGVRKTLQIMVAAGVASWLYFLHPTGTEIAQTAIALFAVVTADQVRVQHLLETKRIHDRTLLISILFASFYVNCMVDRSCQLGQLWHYASLLALGLANMLMISVNHIYHMIFCDIC